MILHKERTLQCLQQRFLSYVGIAVVNEGAGFHIPVGIDVQIAPSAGNAAVCVFTVIPEVQRKQRLFVPHGPNKVIHVFPLLSAGHQFWHSVRAYRHVSEEPHKLCAEIDQAVIVGLAANDIHIFAGIAAAGSEEQLPLPKDIHGPNDFLIGALSAPVIRGIFKAFNGDRGHKVLYTQHFVSKGFIDERSIGKGQECRFRMAFPLPDGVHTG